MALALAGMSGVSPIARSETQTTVTHTLDPLAAMEAKLAILPPEVAAVLRAQLLPPRMIDVTPTSAHSSPALHDSLGVGEDMTAGEIADQKEAEGIRELAEEGFYTDEEADALLANLL